MLAPPVRRDPNIRVKVNVWGCISSHGYGYLYIFEENLASLLMCTIYQDALLPSVADLFGDNQEWLLQEDNDTKHISNLSWNIKAGNNINCIEWTSNSADLNPMENVWSFMKYQLGLLQLDDITQLVDAIENIWTNPPWKSIRETFFKHNSAIIGVSVG